MQPWQWTTSRVVLFLASPLLCGTGTAQKRLERRFGAIRVTASLAAAVAGAELAPPSLGQCFFDLMIAKGPFGIGW